MTKMILPVAAMPSAISESIAVTLRAHGLTFSPELLAEIGRNTTQALFAYDLASEVEEPSVADRLAVGDTLRCLAAAGQPNADTAPALARVGSWLRDGARAELAAAMGGTVEPGRKSA